MPIFHRLSGSSSSSDEFHDCLNSRDLSDPEEDNSDAVEEDTNTTTTTTKTRRRTAARRRGARSPATEQVSAEAAATAMDHDVHNHSAKEASLEDGPGGEIHGSQKEFDDEIDEESMRSIEESLSAEELEANRDKALAMKEEANALFRADKTEEAIAVYTNALKISPLKYSKERAILYGNRAAAKIKFDARKSALDDCTKALDLWPQYVRVILRYESGSVAIACYCYDGDDDVVVGEPNSTNWRTNWTRLWRTINVSMNWTLVKRTHVRLWCVCRR